MLCADKAEDRFSRVWNERTGAARRRDASWGASAPEPQGGGTRARNLSTAIAGGVNGDERPKGARKPRSKKNYNAVQLKIISPSKLLKIYSALEIGESEELATSEAKLYVNERSERGSEQRERLSM